MPLAPIKMASYLVYVPVIWAHRTTPNNFYMIGLGLAVILAFLQRLRPHQSSSLRARKTYKNDF